MEGVIILAAITLGAGLLSWLADIGDRPSSQRPSISTCARCVDATAKQWVVVGPDHKIVSSDECRPCAEDDAARRGVGFKVRRLA